MSKRTIIDEALVLRFPRGVRLKNDKTRKQWVVLAPERMFVLDDIAQAIMQEVNGVKTVSVIVDNLTEKFQAPREQILCDVVSMLQDFADKGVLAT